MIIDKTEIRRQIKVK